jgi:hypothetical protein
MYEFVVISSLLMTLMTSFSCGEILAIFVTGVPLIIRSIILEKQEPSLSPEVLWCPLSLCPLPFWCSMCKVYVYYTLQCLNCTSMSKIYPVTARPIGLWDVKATLSRQLAHRWRHGCQPYAPATIYSPQTLFFCFWYSFFVRPSCASIKN